MAFQKERFCQEDPTEVAIYKDATEIYKKNRLNNFGFISALKLSEGDVISLLREEKHNNKLLMAVWDEAERTFDDKKEFGSLNLLSAEAKVALRTYAWPSPIYMEFNALSRNLLTFFDWEAFPYKGLFLLMYKAVSSRAGEHTSKTLYRGMNINTEINVGSIIKFQQFTSTSANRRIAEGPFGGKDGTLFIFSNVTHALDIQKLAPLPEEEYLILPNDGFKVTATKVKGNVMEVYLECMQQSLLF